MRDDVPNFEEIRAEINMCEEIVVGIELDISTSFDFVSAPRIDHARYAKNSAYKKQEATDLYKENFFKLF